MVLFLFYSVNLFSYIEVAAFNRFVYWLLLIVLIIIGILKMLLTTFRIQKGNNTIIVFSVGTSVLLVLFLAVSREAYAVTMAFLLLLIKIILFFRWKKI